MYLGGGLYSYKATTICTLPTYGPSLLMTLYKGHPNSKLYNNLFYFNGNYFKMFMGSVLDLGGGGDFCFEKLSQGIEY